MPSTSPFYKTNSFLPIEKSKNCWIVVTDFEQNHLLVCEKYRKLKFYLDKNRENSLTENQEVIEIVQSGGESVIVKLLKDSQNFPLTKVKQNNKILVLSKLNLTNLAGSSCKNIIDQQLICGNDKIPVEKYI